jgi:hypothetical protein
MTRRRWSDPDELLEEWARLSALAPPERFRRARRRSVLSAVGAVAGGLAVLAVGLMVVAIVAQQLGGMASRPGDGRFVELPTHKPMHGSPAALLEGRLERDGDCVYAADVDLGTRSLVIWPQGTTMRVHEGEADAIVDGGGRVIALIGEVVRLGGGSFGDGELDFLRTLLASDIADECLGGPYWLATSAQSAWGEPGPATWRIDPSDPPSPESTSVAVLLTERACAGGRTPEGRILPPDVVYHADRIVISLSVRSWPGDCPSNPEHRLTVELDQPIGDRVLADGHGGDIRWPIALPTTQPTTTPAVASTSPSPTPIADEWSEWQFWLGDYHPLLEAMRELSRHFPAPAAGEPPAAMTLTSPLFDRLDRAILRQLDEEIAASGGVNRMSERVPGFWLGDAPGAVEAFGAQDLVEDGDASWLVLPDPEWHARRLRGFVTPAGHEAWVMDEALVAHRDCALLVVPPFRADGVDLMDSNTSREEGFADVYIFGEGDSHVQVTVRHDDPACMAHPVMGPILEHLLSDD